MVQLASFLWHICKKTTEGFRDFIDVSSMGCQTAIYRVATAQVFRQDLKSGHPYKFL